MMSTSNVQANSQPAANSCEPQSAHAKIVGSGTVHHSSAGSTSKQDAEQFIQLVRGVSRGTHFTHSSRQSGSESAHQELLSVAKLEITQALMQAEIETPKAESSQKINKMLYELVLNWPAFKQNMLPNGWQSTVQQSGESVDRQTGEFLIVLGAFLTLGANYSTKVAQMLDELLEIWPSSQHEVYFRQWSGQGGIYKSALVLVWYLAQKKYLVQVQNMVNFL